MSVSSDGKMSAKERRRRRILMSNSDEEDGTPSKIGGLILSETTAFTNLSETEYSTNVSENVKQTHILKESQLLKEGSTKDVHFITSDKNAKEMVSYKSESQNYSSRSTSEELPVNYHNTREFQSVKDEESESNKEVLTYHSFASEPETISVSMETSGVQDLLRPDEDLITDNAGVASKRMRLTNNAKSSVGASKNEIRYIEGYEEVKRFNREVSDTVEVKGFADIKRSRPALQQTLSDQHHHYLETRTSYNNSPQQKETNEQDMFNKPVRHVEEISSATELHMVNSEVSYDMQENDSLNILYHQTTQRDAGGEPAETLAEIIVHDINEEEERQSESKMQTPSHVTVKRKVKFSPHHPEINSQNRKLVETNQTPSETVVFATENTNKSENSEDSIPLRIKRRKVDNNPVFENISATKREVLESSILHDQAIENLFGTQNKYTGNSPLRHSNHTPVHATKTKPKQTTKKYRVHCYLELSPVPYSGTLRKWKSEPILNITRKRENLEKKPVQKQSSLSIQLRKATSHRPLAPAYALNDLPFETIIRNEVNFKLKKKRRKSYPPPTLKKSVRDIEVHHIMGHEVEKSQEIDIPKIKRKTVELVESSETAFYVDEVDNKDTSKRDFIEDHIITSNGMDTLTSPLKRRNVSVIFILL